MTGIQNEKRVLRTLAERYSAIASQNVQRERIERYFDTISLQEVRPVVLIDEVPWGEIDDDLLRLRCKEKEHCRLERRLRQALYQWDHFQADMVIPPVFRVSKRILSTGIGIEVQETLLKASTGTDIMSHEYADQLQTDEAVDNLKLPRITYDREGTERAAELAADVFSGLLPVELEGATFQYNIWDRISTYRGVDKLLLDLAMRPEFMHRTARKFMEIAKALFRQYLDLGLLEARPLLLHCTPACARELPAVGFTGTIRPKDVWGRCAAQIFASVSPEMHDEFDLQYNQEVFAQCGLVYYGCCEPMDKKIDVLRKRFSNLRKISITPWADAENAASNIGSDLVLAAKPNPAFVALPVFESEPVEQEISRYLAACKRHGTTCEFVLKDISTISNNPANLIQWADTVKEVIDRYY